MVLVLLALAAGVVAGYARGGRLRRLTADPPVRSRLILTALGLYVVGVAGSWAWEPLLPVSTAAFWGVLAFYAWLNRSRHGARLITLGLAANGLVILVNGAMPVSESARATAGHDATAPATSSATATTVDDSTIVPWLGKTVPVAFPPRPEVVSPGDIAVAAGAAAVLATGMIGRRLPSGHRLPSAAGTGSAEARPRPRASGDHRQGNEPDAADSEVRDPDTTETTSVDADAGPASTGERATMSTDVDVDDERRSPRAIV